MNLNKVQDKIIEEFETIIGGMKNKFNYFRYLAGWNADKPAPYKVEKKEENLVKTTKSKVWLQSRYVDGKIYYAGDSDSQVMKGIVTLITDVFSGRTAREIVNANIYFLNEIKLYSQLSIARIQELSAILMQITTDAVKYERENSEEASLA